MAESSTKPSSQFTLNTICGRHPKTLLQQRAATFYPTPRATEMLRHRANGMFCPVHEYAIQDQQQQKVHTIDLTSWFKPLLTPFTICYPRYPAMFDLHCCVALHLGIGTAQLQWIKFVRQRQANTYHLRSLRVNGPMVDRWTYGGWVDLRMASFNHASHMSTMGKIIHAFVEECDMDG